MCGTRSGEQMIVRGRRLGRGMGPRLCEKFIRVNLSCLVRAMSSIRRWVLAHSELESAGHMGLTLVPVEWTLISRLHCDCWCVGLQAMIENPCLCDREVSGLR